jgi:hypothetical protein
VSFYPRYGIDGDFLGCFVHGLIVFEFTIQDGKILAGQQAQD